ncbi:hypothetical protein [Deinococcus sp.]|uniref:hypothetical protein n=1 Tax=Deinococcus sp. TaxID=47478 RepID=UPI0025CCFE3F|nr:hypothetical protein [Deinococcus sp.]
MSEFKQGFLLGGLLFLVALFVLSRAGQAGMERHQWQGLVDDEQAAYLSRGRK